MGMCQIDPQGKSNKIALRRAGALACCPSACCPTCVCCSGLISMDFVLLPAVAWNRRLGKLKKNKICPVWLRNEGSRAAAVVCKK